MIEESPIGSKVTGFYLGKVMMHLNHGMLKVFIPGVYPDSMKDQPELLPNCMQVVSQFGGSHAGNGLFTYPNIGSTVVCSFANNDQNMPFCIGSILGGENAFGQYDIVKSQKEKVSSKHLITSGKSQIEIFEDGKISAIVEDPVSTSAIIDYHDDKNILSILSTDCISARPICDKIDNNEISNIHCKLVLDNQLSNGSILENTHHFLNTSIDDEKQTLIEKLTYDNDQLMNNSGCIKQSIVSSYQMTQNDKQSNVITNIMLKAKTQSDIDLFNGFCNKADIELNKTRRVNGQSSTEVKDNHLTASFVTADQMKSEVHFKSSKKIDGNSVYDSDCYDVIDGVKARAEKSIQNNMQGFSCLNKVTMDSTVGKLEITIKDLDSGKSCTYTLDKQGNAKLETSTTVTIISPNVEITGATHVTGTLTVTKNIIGEMDVIASNCTLNTHVHPVPAHCPSAGITLIGK